MPTLYSTAQIARPQRKRDYFTTGDVAREVGCDDLTVRRYLADKGIVPQNGKQHKFTQKQKNILVRRLKAARLLYGKHLRRYEHSPRLFTIEMLISV